MSPDKYCEITLGYYYESFGFVNIDIEFDLYGEHVNAFNTKLIPF